MLSFQPPIKCYKAVQLDDGTYVEVKNLELLNKCCRARCNSRLPYNVRKKASDIMTMFEPLVGKKLNVEFFTEGEIKMKKLSSSLKESIFETQNQFTERSSCIEHTMIDRLSERDVASETGKNIMVVHPCSDQTWSAYPSSTKEQDDVAKYMVVSGLGDPFIHIWTKNNSVWEETETVEYKTICPSAVEIDPEVEYDASLEYKFVGDFTTQEYKDFLKSLCDKFDAIPWVRENGPFRLNDTLMDLALDLNGNFSVIGGRADIVRSKVINGLKNETIFTFPLKLSTFQVGCVGALSNTNIQRKAQQVGVYTSRKPYYKKPSYQFKDNLNGCERSVNPGIVVWREATDGVSAYKYIMVDPQKYIEYDFEGYKVLDYSGDFCSRNNSLMQNMQGSWFRYDSTTSSYKLDTSQGDHLDHIYVERSDDEIMKNKRRYLQFNGKKYQAVVSGLVLERRV